MNIKEQLKDILDGILMEEIDFDKPEANLQDDYGMNSMDAVDLADRIERAFGVEVETEAIADIKTVGDALSFIETRLEAKKAAEDKD